MKIKQITISGFGKWSNVTFTDLEDWQVFYGQNEAGKSTLKDFVLGVFFGFPTGGKANVQLYEPRSGAKYGGFVDIDCQKGAFRITRMGRVQSKLSVTERETGMDMPNPEKFLNDLFSPLTKEDYQNIYSFNEVELGEVQRLTEVDLEQTLLSFTKPQAQRFLNWAQGHDKEAAKRFGKSVTSKRELNLAIKDYGRLENERKQKQSGLADYRRAEQAVLSVSEKQNAAKQAVAKRQADYQASLELKKAWAIYKQNRSEQSEDAPNASENPAATASPANFTVQAAQLADQDWQPALEEAINIESELKWLSEQIEKNGKDLATLQAQLKANEGKRNTSDLKQKCKALSQNLDRLFTLNQELSQAEETFGGHIPEPLSRREELILDKSRNGVWPMVITALVAAAGFVLSLAFGLVLSCAFIAVAAHFTLENKRAKDILDRFAPLTKEEVFEKQAELQAIVAKRHERRETSDQQQTLTQSVLNAMVAAGQKAQAEAIQGESSQRILQVVQQYLAQEESEGQNRTFVRLDEATTQQADLYQKQGDAQKRLALNLNRFGFETLDDFKAFSVQQRQMQRSKDRENAARDQVGEALWEKVQAIEKECQGDTQKVDARLNETLASKETDLQAEKKKQDALQNQLEDARVELNSLAGDESLSAVDQKMENQMAYMKDGFTDYLAKRLLVPVVNQAFLGKQDRLSDEVLVQGSAYLAQLSEGDYEEIVLEDGKLSVAGKAESRFAIHELSAGAKDIVYLALRLALATSLELKESFPIMVDDAFVHLDDEKRKRALSLMQEIAFDQQVLFWTFNPEVEGKKKVDLNAYS